VADGQLAVEVVQRLLAEDLVDHAHVLVERHRLPVRNGDPCGFLPTMLQRKEAEEGEPRRVFLRREQPDHAAFFLRVFVVQPGITRRVGQWNAAHIRLSRWEE
jgi:hypothetical protein